MEYHFKVHEIGRDAPLYVITGEVRFVVDLLEVPSDIVDALLDLVVLVGLAAEGGNNHIEKNQQDDSQ